MPNFQNLISETKSDSDVSSSKPKYNDLTLGWRSMMWFHLTLVLCLLWGSRFESREEKEKGGAGGVYNFKKEKGKASMVIVEIFQIRCYLPPLPQPQSPPLAQAPPPPPRLLEGNPQRRETDGLPFCGKPTNLPSVWSLKREKKKEESYTTLHGFQPEEDAVANLALLTRIPLLPPTWLQ